jgi:hypothetical protein
VDTGLEARRQALKTGPYGRCVYHCDNDVVDHQIAGMEMESGASVTLFMHGHSNDECRTMRYDGTRATLRGKFAYATGSIEIHDHLTGRIETIEPEMGVGHGGGDEGLVSSFVRALRAGNPQVLTSARNSLESHLMAFAADKSRLESTIVSMPEYRTAWEQAAQG